MTEKAKNSNKILVFHPAIAPYRIDFFNDLYSAFDARISIYYRNLEDQKFNYEKIERKFVFQPDYFNKSIKILGRKIPVGFTKRLKEFEPDLVIVNEYSESFWVTWLYRLITHKKYKIISICDDSVDIFNHEGGLHAVARNKAVKRIDGIVLCNDLVKKAYKMKYPYARTFVMPIIQDETKFFENKESLICRTKNILQEECLVGKRVFLYVGRISPEKNLLYLVKSFITQHDNNSDNVLYVIGNSTPDNQIYHDEINDFIKENNAASYVRMIGRKEGEELKAWFYAGQVLVVPSVREAFGAVTNEALLCGDYVMVSSIAGSTCLVDEKNGEIIDVFKPTIDFSGMNERVPLQSLRYIEEKKSKMMNTYKSYINAIQKWIETL